PRRACRAHVGLATRHRNDAARCWQGTRCCDDASPCRVVGWSRDVTFSPGRLKEGDRAASQALWERYFRRLVGLARERLRGWPRAAADEADVTLSAFDSFCRAAEAGRFPRLDNPG